MKKIICFYLVFIFTLIAARGYSQINLHWTNNYNGSSNFKDEGKAGIADNSGNVYVTGSSMNSGTFQDYTTIKYSSNGTQLWTAIYNDPSNGYDQATLITFDNAGNVIVSGYTTGLLSNIDITTVKYNSDGVRQWVSTFNGNGNFKDFPTSIETDQSGNVYVTGQTYGGAPTNYDVITLKYSPSGAQLWAVTYNGSGNGNDIGSSLEVDASENVYVTGSGFESPGTFDFVTLKYNSAGVQSWVSKYGGTSTGIDFASDITLDNSGNVYITGTSYEIFYDFATIKYDNSGVQQWVSRYNGANNGNDEASSILLDATGNVFVAGSSRISGNYYDYAVIKYNNSGAGQWLRTYNGQGNQQDSLTSMFLDLNGNVIVTGYSTGNGSGKDITTVKYDNAGVFDWAAVYNGSDNLDDIAYSVTVNSQSEVFITGKENKTSSSEDFTTIKYSKVSGIHGSAEILKDHFTLFNNYPNPFNPSTIISFNIPVSSYVKLNIYDTKGNLMETIVDNKLAAGYHQVSFNPTGMTSGVYFYNLQADNFMQTKKMVFVK